MYLLFCLLIWLALYLVYDDISCYRFLAVHIKKASQQDKKREAPNFLSREYICLLVKVYQCLMGISQSLKLHSIIKEAHYRRVWCRFSCSDLLKVKWGHVWRTINPRSHLFLFATPLSLALTEQPRTRTQILWECPRLQLDVKPQAENYVVLFTSCLLMADDQRDREPCQTCLIGTRSVCVSAC